MADVQLSTRSVAVKTAYEANANTNAFTDAEKAKVASSLVNITGLVTQGSGVTITGSGTSGSPYQISASGSAPAFNTITSGTNTTATMTVGTGGSMTTTGTGTIAATTAAALQTARTIGGVSFDGTANIVPQTIQVVDAAADTTTFVLLAGSATGNLQPMTDAGISYNASTNILTVNISGNATTVTTNANLTGDITSTGNATSIAAGVIVDADVNASAAIARTKLAALTASRLMVTNASGFDTVNSVTATEAGYLSGVTSAIQTQLNAKAATTQTLEGAGGLIGGALANGDYMVFLKMPHGGTITETTTRCTSGTATATFKINTTPLGGTANAVSTSEQSQAQASSNVFAAGDDIVITISSNSSCTNMSFMIKYTRTLS